MVITIKFNWDSDGDVINYFNTLENDEVRRIVAVSAFRMYMRATGFYEQQRESDPAFSNEMEQTRQSENEVDTIEGIYDAEAFKELGSMFDRENEMDEDED